MRAGSFSIAGLLLSVCACATWDGTAPPPGVAGSGEVAAADSSVLVIAEPWIGGCGNGCYNAYRKFAAKYYEHSRYFSEERLNEILAEAEALPGPFPIGLSDAELRARIIEALNIGFLLDGIDRRVLAVAALRDEEMLTGDIRRRKLLFWDPAVGSFEGTLLLPRGDGPHPAIIGLHGHRHDDSLFSSEFLGEQLARRGFAVMMPRLRLQNCSFTEGFISYRLLRYGFPLIGLHTYETLLMLKYLESLESVEAGRIGIIGHSGGCPIATLAARLDERVSALVIDLQIDFRDYCRSWLKDVHCETVPWLVPIAADINHLESPDLPLMQVTYKFQDDDTRSEILRFFEEHLQKHAVAVDYGPFRREETKRWTGE
jgi:dienelactone hydrolase